MSLLVCKKCYSTIVAKDKTPNARDRNYICPVCGTSINTFNIKYYLIAFAVLFLLWAISFFSHHISEGNLKWDSANQSSLLLAVIMVTSIAFAIYRHLKVNDKSKKWVVLGCISLVLLLNEIHIAASRVWGL
ncbi:hypothetical protein [Pseudoalteromonas sp. ASV78]|uniref:hypothetical protein n=1 Tax=Pseudoalteromonas sp. ASV78 TaxID=3397851 RepID=UPI0039FCF63F